MRRLTILSCLLIMGVAFAAVAEPLQRGQRGGGRGMRRGERAPQMSEEQLLENFDKIVEIIMSDDEEGEWDDLDTDEQKQAFITAFWERRDPTDGTEDNEFRDIWMGRATTAARTFGREGRLGYETDRGKFFMVYGDRAIVAQQIKQVSGTATGGTNVNTGGDAGARQGAGRGMNMIWTLDPTQNPYLEDKEEVVFAQYQRSYSRITGGIELSQQAFLANQDVKTYFEARRANPASAGPAAGGVLAPGAGPVAPAPTPDARAMTQLMQQGVTQQDLALKQEMSFIPAGQGNTFTIVNFEVGKDGLTFGSEGAEGPASLLAFGVLLEQDETQPNGERFMRAMRIDFSAAPGDGDDETIGTRSFGMTLAPGEYRLAWGVMDVASERIVTTSGPFEVPNFSVPELGITSVILAAGATAQTDQLDVNTIYAGTRVGNVSLATDVDNVFGRNDEILVLYFLTGLGVDASTRQSRFEVDHRILLAETGDSIMRLPGQTLGGGPVYPIQQSVPLAQVEQLDFGTDYRIQIHVKDLVSGNEITREVPFSTAGGEE